MDCAREMAASAVARIEEGKAQFGASIAVRGSYRSSGRQGERPVHV